MGEGHSRSEIARWDSDEPESEISRWDSEGSDERELAARLGALFRAHDPAPADAVEAAQRMFALRQIDVELAALTADSAQDQQLVGVRDGGAPPRLLTFEAAGLALELEISGAGRARRLLGQLLPGGPASIDVRQGAGGAQRRVDTDERGRFAVEDVAPGLVSLVCRRQGQRPVATAWTTVT